MTSVVFFGNTSFSATILKWLSKESSLTILGVVTRPDKPVGRKKIMTPTPVKEYALKEKIQVYETEKLSTVFDSIQSLRPDLCVVAAYGKIIPKASLTLPKYGCLNVHASLLPKYRGASPIQHAILSGEKKTGITIMKINEKLDQGPILTQGELPIEDTDTTETLSLKLADLGAKLLIKALPLYLNGALKPKPQKDTEATYCSMVTHTDAKIDWMKPQDETKRKIRAMYPEPLAWTEWNGKKLQFLPGNRVKLEGKKEMLFDVFLRGHKDFTLPVPDSW
ncbi:MAG TPA: methionyl-tRNA formyltransferase [Patescibacteria group bacterium]|nr:methionyl-tRNA formyltransferase [Patescibacteria group bacterium]